MGRRTEFDLKIGVDFRIAVLVGRVQNAGRTVRVIFSRHLVTDIVRHEGVLPLNHLPQKSRTDRVDEVRRKNTAGQHIHLVGRTALLIVVRGPVIIKILPEGGGVDAAILDLFKRRLLSVNIVHGEQARNPHPPGGGGDQSGHPVVAVNQIRLHARNDVVDHFALKSHRLQNTVFRVIAVDSVPIVENPVLGQMNAAVVQVVHVNPQFVADQVSHVDVEHPPVMRQRHMHIRPLTEQRCNQRSGNIRQPSRLGVQTVDHIPHAFRQIGDFRRHHQNTGALPFLLHRSTPLNSRERTASAVPALSCDRNGGLHIAYFGQHMKPGTLLSQSVPGALIRAVSPNRPANLHWTLQE